MKFINFPNLVAFDDVRKKVSSARRKETWARVSTAPTHRATTAPDLDRLRCEPREFNPIVTFGSGAYSQLSLNYILFWQ